MNTLSKEADPSADQNDDPYLLHASFYLSIARKAEESYLEGGPRILEGLRLFDAELSQIRAGQLWSATNSTQDRAAAQICIQYSLAYHVLQLRMDGRDQVKSLQVALQAAQDLGDRIAEAIHSGNLGVACRNLGDVRKAREYQERATRKPKARRGRDTLPKAD